MAAIFINYRTPDEPAYAVLLKQELSRVFGECAVFLAATMVPAGEDFERELLRRVRGAEVLLAVVGPRWLSATNAAGTRALDDPDDWVRREITEAFDNGVRVVPVLTGPTPRLTDAPLPAELARLATCQYLRLRHNDFPADLARIVEELTALVTAPRARSPERGGAAVTLNGEARDNGRVYQAGRDLHLRE
ncbi:toll/interleukin-1 receptor domain-containing protein [Actinophytocola xanthii]|uniref:TIR domain-containing protein n=1 Tax=Actinophytocola xanthii TaxID=1912961 RepID=A0A1Q8C4H7_9PSEU|nr:toll/interleukin-1 receptor domain-containing protein [Actinophytocola xanthii]OLF09250.1 hypothetical protein BU204_33275 [Actinophytocola xanthii]